jgi:hypothetical protein
MACTLQDIHLLAFQYDHLSRLLQMGRKHQQSFSIKQQGLRCQNCYATRRTMPRDAELYRLTASEASRQIRSGSLTVEVYVKSLLSRIKAREPLVKAWAYLDATLILEEAQRLDRVLPKDRGILHGVPIGIKGVMYTQGNAS